MCLAVPALVKTINGGEAEVELGGATYKTSIVLTPEVKVGDYVLLHTGYTISIVDAKEAEETIQLIREIEAIEP